jgi:UTP--glucose-1-phosphate uridylyltransferase
MKIRTAVFPVAGLGTRFLPATKAIPKEMLVVGDKPLIQHAVEEAKAAGIERFIFVTSQGKTAIEDHFDTHKLLERTLEDRHKLTELEKVRSLQLGPGEAIFIRQQEPLGLGHAVWCARHLVGDDPFALLLADDMILGAAPCIAQMIDAYETHGRGNYTAVMEVDPAHVSRYGILDIDRDDGTVIQAKHVVEKPTPAESPSTTAIVGRYILDPMTFEMINLYQKGAGKEIQLTDAFKPMIDAGIPFYGVRFSGQRYDCGTKEGWLEANLVHAYTDEASRDHLLTILKKLTSCSKNFT